MKRIVLLGSTGSIGTQTLDIVRRLPGRFQVLGLAANRNADLLASQAREFGARWVSIGTEAEVAPLRAGLGPGTCVLSGIEGMCELATLPEAGLVVMAVAGAVGIRPTHAALEAGKDVALASKEVLVAAGEHTMRLASQTGARILPIDSEHSALFQCLQGAPEKSVEKLFLTASGGPFRTRPLEQLKTVSPEEALKHPTWNMGGLVTVNSATLMNKGLEIVEAHWLFGVDADDVEVVIHPQSIVHSMVRFRDGSTLAQLGLPDMRLPIQYALVHPERVDSQLPRMELGDYANLTFEAPDLDKFPSLGLAREAIRRGGTMPAVLNAANEAAVARFLNRELSFLGIAETVEQVMRAHSPCEPTYENVLSADEWARHKARELPSYAL